MPWDEVMHKFKSGTLKSGGKTPVKNRSQAIAIMLSEKRKSSSKPEYRSIAPSKDATSKMTGKR